MKCTDYNLEISRQVHALIGFAVRLPASSETNRASPYTYNSWPGQADLDCLSRHPKRDFKIYSALIPA